MGTTKYERWAVEDYPEAAEDFTNWMFVEICEARNIHPTQEDPEVWLRFKAEVMTRVIERTQGFNNLVERAEIYQAWQANREGWFHFLPGEYNSLEEFLASITDPEAKPSSMGSDLSWLVKDFFPALESNGIDPNTILGAPASSSKMRAAVPQLRTVLKEKQGEELVECLKDIIGDVLDPSVSWRAFRDKLPRYKGASYDSVWGDVYNLQNYSMIVIRDDTGGPLLRHIQRKLGNAIEFRGPKDPVDLLKELSDELLGEDVDDSQS